MSTTPKGSMSRLGRRRSSHRAGTRRQSAAAGRRRSSAANSPEPLPRKASGTASSWLRKDSRGGPGSLSRRRSRQGSLADSLRSIGDARRPTINAELDSADRAGLEEMLKDEELRGRLEDMWYAFLDHDPYLSANQADVKLFRQWAKQAGLVRDAGPRNERRMEAERDTARVLDSAHIAMGVDDVMDMAQWMRALCHVAFYMNPEMDGDHDRGMRWLITTHLDDWLQRHRARNENDGMQPGDGLFQPLDCDRLLYVYDTPFQKLFDRYKAHDQHKNRDLGFDQVKMLNDFVELSELRDFCKEYGLFPKVLSYSEISKVAQLSCFGRIVADPTRQAQGTDGLMGVAAAKARGQGDGDHRQYEDEAGQLPPQPQEFMGMNTDIGLGVGLVTSEGVTEPLLDRTMFMDSVMRLAQIVYQRTDKDRREIPTIVARVEALLRHMRPTYRAQFGRELQDDCDWDVKGPPVLKCTAENVACSGPQGPRGSCKGGYDITIDGQNFCTKRGVYVKFFDPMGKTARPFVVKARHVRPRRVWVGAPAVVPTDVHVECTFDSEHNSWSVAVSRVAVLRVECSNDRHHYTETDPEQNFVFQDVCPPWYVADELAAQALKVFQNVVSFQDRRNTRFLTKAKWKRFKADYGIVEQVLQQPRPGEQDYDEVEEPHFKALAQQQILPPLVGRDGDSGIGPTRSELVIGFAGFLRLLVRCFCEFQIDQDDVYRSEFNHLRPLEMIRELMETAALKEDKKVEHNIDDIKDEIKTTRKLIDLVERKTVRELDVYCGPVLCATLTDRPGYMVFSSAAKASGAARRHPLEVPQPGAEGDSGRKGGLRESARRRHRFLSCVMHDTNTEEALLMHVHTADSFDHLFSRLTSDHFDVAASADPATRKPAGRCWHVYYRGDKLGALWDYGGHYSNHEWQPQHLDSHHPSITMTVYRNHTDLDYVICYLLYNKAKNIKEMRNLLAQRGYTLRTCLYRV